MSLSFRPVCVGCSAFLKLTGTSPTTTQKYSSVKDFMIRPSTGLVTILASLAIVNLFHITTHAFIFTSHRCAICRKPQEITSTSLFASFSSVQEALYQREMNSRKKSSWLNSVSSLPFDCTSCGKCCRTIGNVFMSPEEIIMAAQYSNKTVQEFIQTYASHVILESEESPGNASWILLDNRETQNGPQCIFLDEVTNHCKIYPVRPIQCSTYPFWPSILKNKLSWNEEVRRMDDESSSALPPWTAEDGGCEGMQTLNDKTDDESQITGLPIQSPSFGVPIERALEQLTLYEQSDRRMPRRGVTRRVQRSIETGPLE